jgi:cell wall-associated NlpC family hydrolase
MDCSGSVFHVLEFQGLKGVPRQSDEMCRWVEKRSQLHLTPTAAAFDHAEFTDLKPGDLLFWTNTTETKRKLPVTHVMIYLGKLKKNGKRVVFGASDGRSFQGERRSGVSVFDFHLPKAESTSRLHGYGPAPGLLPIVIPEKPVVTVAPPPTPEVKPAPAVTPKNAAPNEEVRKAVAIVSKSPTAAPPPASKPAVKSAPKSSSPSKATSTKKPTPPAAKTNSPAQIKARVERSLDKAADSVRRLFQR